MNVPVVNQAWVDLFTEVIGPNDIDPNRLARAFGYRAYFDMGAIGDIFVALGMPRESLELLLGLPAGAEKPRFKPTRATYRHTPRMLRMLLAPQSLRSAPRAAAADPRGAVCGAGRGRSGRPRRDRPAQAGRRPDGPHEADGLREHRRAAADERLWIAGATQEREAGHRRDAGGPGQGPRGHRRVRPAPDHRGARGQDRVAQRGAARRAGAGRVRRARRRSGPRRPACGGGRLHRALRRTSARTATTSRRRAGASSPTSSCG